MMESSLNQAFDAFRIEAESLAETAKVHTYSTRGSDPDNDRF